MAFAVFGLGSLALAFVAFPCLRLVAGNARKEIRIQRAIHGSFGLFVWFMERLGLIRVIWIGIERLREPGPRLVIANHPTLIDVVLLIACMPQADCVIKRAHWQNRFTRQVVTSAGYIPNIKGNALVDACVARLREGRSLLLFPEGTRSPPHELGPVQRGAAHIAVRSGCDLLPVIIRCTPPTLMKGARWYDVPDRTVQLTVEVGRSLIVPAGDDAPDAGSLAARRLTERIREFYTAQLSRERAEHARS